MTEQHPITPPDDLQEQWKQEWLRVRPAMTPCIQWLLAKSAQWGYEQRDADIEDELQKARDQEMEACCERLDYNCPSVGAHHLRNDRRPKLPSLAEQALAVLDPSKTYGSITREEEYRISVANAEIIRRALEALPDD